MTRVLLIDDDDIGIKRSIELFDDLGLDYVQYKYPADALGVAGNFDVIILDMSAVGGGLHTDPESCYQGAERLCRKFPGAILIMTSALGGVRAMAIRDILVELGVENKVITGGMIWADNYSLKYILEDEGLPFDE